MYIDGDGVRQYTLKERIAYHNECANSGKKDGKKLSFTERQNHAKASARCRKKLGKLMNSFETADKLKKFKNKSSKG